MSSLYILTSHPKLVIPQSQVNLSKEAYPLELIKQIVNLRERILVRSSDFIELAVINTHSKDPSFLFTNENGAPHGEILGQMKPLSSKSLS